MSAKYISEDVFVLKLWLRKETDVYEINIIMNY